jgi:thymidine kinase
MNKSILLSLSVVTLLASCSSVENACEDVTLASEQIQECQALHKQIINAKSVIIRTELDRRYQQNCVEIRYYRDEKQAAICGNKHKIKEVRKSVAAESKQ